MADNDTIDPEEVDREFRELEALVEEASESVDESERRLQSEDRSKIAKRIVWLFIAACSGILLFIAIAVFWRPDGAVVGWEEAAKQMVVILSSVILPVVTLVIGYYFGSENKQK